jgi:hypothetical protein
MTPSMNMGETRVRSLSTCAPPGLVQRMCAEVADAADIRWFVFGPESAADLVVSRLAASADAVMGPWPGDGAYRVLSLEELVVSACATGVVGVRAGAPMAPPGATPDAWLDGFAGWCVAVLVASAGGRVEAIGEGPKPTPVRVTPKGRAWLVSWALARVGADALRHEMIAAALGRLRA